MLAYLFYPLSNPVSPEMRYHTYAKVIHFISILNKERIKALVKINLLHRILCIVDLQAESFRSPKLLQQEFVREERDALSVQMVCAYHFIRHAIQISPFEQYKKAPSRRTTSGYYIPYDTKVISIFYILRYVQNSA